MDEDQGMPGIHDPEWAKRVAAIEKEFLKAERRRGGGRGRTDVLAKRGRPARRFRTAYIWAIIAFSAVAYAAIAHPWGIEPVPLANAPRPIVAQNADGIPAPSSTGGVSRPPDAPSGGADPFAGSPARGWPTADQGVIMPTATKVGPYSSTQVSAALDLAHRYILLTRADPRVLVDHQLQLLTAMVDPEEVSRSGFQTTGPHSALQPTLLAPGSALSASIRVNGTVNAAYRPDAAGRPMLQVTTNLVWAYPLADRPGVITDGGTIAVRHDQMTLDLFPSDPRLRTRLFVESIRGYQFNMDCAYADQGLLGLPRIDDPSRLPAPSGAMPTGNQAYDPHTAIDVGRSCR